MSSAKVMLVSVATIFLCGCSSLGEWVGNKVADSMIGSDARSCTQKEEQELKNSNLPPNRRCEDLNVGNFLGEERLAKLKQIQERSATTPTATISVTAAKTPSFRFEQPSWAVLPVASWDVRGVLAGKGEGLNCSIPGFARSFFPKKFDDSTPSVGTPTSAIELRFRQSCVMHDLCYRHGHATYGYTQRDCDQMVFDSQVRLCGAIFEEKDQKSNEKTSHDVCRQEAGLVLTGLRIGGLFAYKGDGESTFLEYNPMSRAQHVPFSVARASSQAKPNDTPHPDVFSFSQAASNDGRMIGKIWVAGWQKQPAMLAGLNQESHAMAPPALGKINGEQHNIWVERRQIVNTGIRAYVSKPNDNRLRRVNFSTTQDKEVDQIDCDTPFLQPIPTDRLDFITHGASEHDPNKDSNDKCHPNIKLNGIVIGNIRAYKGLILDNVYRLQQVPPIRGSFSAADQDELLFFARGYYPWHGAKGGRHNSQVWKDSHAGKDYKNQTTIVSRLRQTLENDEKVEPPIASSAVSISEEQEPLVAFRPQSLGIDTLLGLQKEHLCQWRHLAPAWQAEKCVRLMELLPSGSSWADIPPQVLSERIKGQGDTLVFMRACVLTGSNCMDWKRVTKQELPFGSEVMLEYQTLKQRSADPSAWYSAGAGIKKFLLSEFTKDFAKATNGQAISETEAALSIRRGQWMVHSNPDAGAKSSLWVQLIPRPKPGFSGHMPPFDYARQMITLSAK